MGLKIKFGGYAFHITLKHMLWVVLVPLYAFLLSFKLGTASLQTWDEAMYAYVSKDMYQHGVFLYPTLRGKFWGGYCKPPLINWVAMISFLFDKSEFSLRFPIAFFGALLCTSTGMLGWALTKSLKTGILASFLLFVFPGFLLYSRMLMAEVPLTLFVIGALYTHHLALTTTSRRKADSYALLSGTCLGLAVLTKSFVALVPVVALVVYGILGARLRFLQKNFWRTMKLMCLAATLTSAWWYVYMVVYFKSSFTKWYFDYLLRETRLVSLEPVEGHFRSPGDSLKALTSFTKPVGVVFPIIGAFFFVKRSGRSSLPMLLTFAGYWLIYDVISNTFLDWYYVLLLPFLAIFLGNIITTGEENSKLPSTWDISTTQVLVLAIAILAAMELYVPFIATALALTLFAIARWISRFKGFGKISNLIVPTFLILHLFVSSFYIPLAASPKLGYAGDTTPIKSAAMFLNNSNATRIFALFPHPYFTIGFYSTMDVIPLPEGSNATYITKYSNWTAVDVIYIVTLEKYFLPFKNYTKIAFNSSNVMVLRFLK